MEIIFQSISKLNYPIMLFFLYFLLLCGFSCADPPYSNCSENASTYSENSPFQRNLDDLLQILKSNASDSKFYKTTVGTAGDADRVYGLFMCFNYVTQETCRGYIATAADEVLNSLCPNKRDAMVWEEHCQLRYSDTDFFGELDVSGSVPQQNTQNTSQPALFRDAVDATLRSLAREAAYNSSEMYSTGEVPYDGKTIYALVQCTRDLSPDDCNYCLGNSTREILDLYGYSIGARLYGRSCYLRYELYPFYKDELSGDSSTDKKEQDNRSKVWKFAILTVASACLVIAVFGYFAYYSVFNKRNRKGNSEINGQTSHGSLNGSGSGNRDFPFVDFSSIVVATNNFSESNKLGEGGFGPVYKGILRKGKEVAVKRLSFGSEQGSEEFTNEVLLIMKLQHKNLVKLLGFCVDRDEKLLVYEYMPNKSLDVILSSPRLRKDLDWSCRVNIIGGIARGILYLHEDSRLRIIHRDLKASNILLDYDMAPKISDFGMARIFAGSEDQANTATIVGTYGYMAPEYAMEGIYSIKSDVFSFGVLLIEIITGKNNASFHQTQNSPSLLAYAWHLWQNGVVTELMDPQIAYPSEAGDDFLRYLHIGLLCVQEDAYDRPTMSSVIIMLTSESTTLFQPKRPAFFTGRFKDRCKSVARSDLSINMLTVSNVAPR